MRAIFCIICGVVWALFPAVAAERGMAWGAGPAWVLVDKNPDSSFYYDKAGIAKPREGIMRVTMRVVYTDKGKADALAVLKPAKGYEKLFETRFLYELDCKERKNMLLGVTHLDEAGAQLKTFDLSGKTDWEDIPPDARIEVVADSECAP